MFDSLKKKLSGLVEKLTKKVDEKAELQQEALTKAEAPAGAPETKAPPIGAGPKPEIEAYCIEFEQKPGFKVPALEEIAPSAKVFMPAPATEPATPAEPESKGHESAAVPKQELVPEPAATPKPEGVESGLLAVQKPDASAPVGEAAAFSGPAARGEGQKQPSLFTSLADKTRSLRDKLNLLKKLGGAESKQEKPIEHELAPKPELESPIKPEPKPEVKAPQTEVKPKPEFKAPTVELEPAPKPEVKAPLIEVKPMPTAPEAPAEKPKSLKERILGAILETEISGSDLDEILSGFEVDLLENDVALEVTERILADMRASLKGKKVKRGEVERAIRDAVRLALEDVLSKGKGIDLLEEIRKSEKPYKLAFVGINGTGKTTTIAKIANLCLQNGFEPVIAASDTFRAASIEQLEVHANKLGVKLVKHKYGADAAAVAYDAIEHAKAKGKAVVLIDTAGRMQTNANLMDELRKIIRVASPDLVVFVGDSLTGNDAVEQARTFNEVRVDAVILTKSDADAKGGACLSISYAIGKPVLYLGTGQNYSDLVKFTPEWFMEKVGAA